MSFVREICDSEMQQLIQSEDPNEIARILDEILTDLDHNVYHGYNDNYGYYIE